MTPHTKIRPLCGNLSHSRRSQYCNSQSNYHICQQRVSKQLDAIVRCRRLAGNIHNGAIITTMKLVCSLQSGYVILMCSAWASVTIDLDRTYLSQGFFINETGLQFSGAQYFGGWLGRLAMWLDINIMLT